MRFLLAAPTAQADVPQLIAYQGRLTEDNGQPLVGDHNIIFRLYEADRGGQKVWEEAHRLSLSSRDNGVFSIVLGSSTPFGQSAFTRALWLGMEVDQDGEMTPRLRLTAAGYALNADTLDGLQSEQFLRADQGSVAQAPLVLTHPGRALLIHPATPVSPNATLMEIQQPAGQSRFAVQADGDVTIEGDLTVRGALRAEGGGPSSEAPIRLASGSGLAADINGLSLLRCGDGQVLKWQTAGSTWGCAADLQASSVGTLTEVVAGQGLTGGGAAGSVTVGIGAGTGLVAGADAIAADVGTAPFKLVQLDADGALPAVSGAKLTQLNAASLSSGVIAEARLPDVVTRLGSAIESPEIADGTVGAADLAVDSVGASVLRADAIQAGDIEPADLPAHAARHAPNGPDALPTAEAVSVGQANTAGTAEKLARADHLHQGVHGVHATGQPVLSGDVTFAAGDQIVLTQSGQTITIHADPVIGGASAAKASAGASNTVAIEEGDTELLTVSITKTRPTSTLWVLATVQLTNASGGNKTVDLQLTRDAQALDGASQARIGTGGGSLSAAPVTLQAWDAPGAGTYTIRLKAHADGNGAQAGIRRLTVVELP